MAFFGLKLGPWRRGRHTPTKDFNEYPPPGGDGDVLVTAPGNYTVVTGVVV